MTGVLRSQHYWIFCAALAVWFALGWPFLQELATGTARRELPVPVAWLAPFAIFGMAALGSILASVGSRLQWTLVGAQLAAVLAMAVIYPSDIMSVFLIIVAWQVALATGPVKALAWVLLQTLAVVWTLSQTPAPDLSFLLVLSFLIQLSFVFTAQALRREAEAARALTLANRELESAQAIIADSVRDAERLRIARELHDAWGKELTALGLQIEIASRVTEPDRANDHVVQARRLARALLAKVRGAVVALRGSERSDWMLVDTGRADPSSTPSQVVAPEVSAEVGTNLRSPDEDVRRAQSERRRQWMFCIAALGLWLVVGWPVLQAFLGGAATRDPLRSALWLASFAVFGAAVFAAMALNLRAKLQWAMLCLQLAAVAALAFIASWAMMSAFLIIIAWQVAMKVGPTKALAWVALQTMIVIGALALAPKPDLCWVLGKTFALQLFFVFTAQALRREAETARALVQTNKELTAAQAMVAATVRDAERLRISRELHDAWGHELTALGLQLEIASHITDPARAGGHVMQAKGLVRGLLAKVRDVVTALHEPERCDLRDSLEMLAQSVPKPAIHVAIAPDVRVSAEQAHALMRCAQEAVTNAVKHSQASNLWLVVIADESGVRLVARNDGRARAAASPPGAGLVGMRERLESLGGRLAVRREAESGFTLEAWLPSRAPQPA